MFGSGDWNVSHPRIWVEWNTSDARIANSRGLRFYGCSRLITRRGGFFASVKLDAGMVLRQRYSSRSRFRDSNVGSLVSGTDISNARNPVDRGSICLRSKSSVAQGDFAGKKLRNTSSIISFYTSGRFAEKRTSKVYCIEWHNRAPKGLCESNSFQQLRSSSSRYIYTFLSWWLIVARGVGVKRRFLPPVY